MPRVKQLSNNQFVVMYLTEDTEVISFQSYESTIIVIDRINRLIEVHPDYDYSNTTSKYRNMFFEREGFLNINTTRKLKSAIKDGKTVNYRGVQYNVVLIPRDEY